MRRFCVILPLIHALTAAHGALVHVYQQSVVGNVTNQFYDEVFQTGIFFATQTAPTINGYIFTHWTISTSQAFATRDAWGRAYDAPTFMLYEDTTLTAHYISVSQDEDVDGVADGYELYWYGNLSPSGDSDTDGDGLTFAQELANRTSPIMPDEDIDGPVRYSDSELWLYNPLGYNSVVIRSEPESSLFVTREEWLRPGTAVSTASFSPLTSTLAYWVCNGVPMRDVWGCANASISSMISTNTIELVAVSESNYATRMSLYWYGNTTTVLDSDTDGDGLTFAQELANGTNPLMADEDIEGPIRYADGDLLRYNPCNYQPYVMRCDPEGALFVTVSNYVRAGCTVVSEMGDSVGGNFAYWTINGIEQRDAWGRAIDTITLQMPTNAVTLIAQTVNDDLERASLYWYGNTTTPLDSDTDDDGLTFAQELANGTNPLMADEDVEGPVRYADTVEHEMNLQPYEQVQGAIVNDQFKHFFTSPIAGNAAQSETFDENLQPIVWDLNGDGLFDLVLVYKGGYKTFVNVGYRGNPEFEERKDIALGGVDLDLNDVSRLAGLTLDVAAPEDALSATTNGTALLVSDSAGRIWYYQSPTPTQDSKYSLQHKVWGGSHAGFAEGLRLAAVDWDEDGDLDCLAGTANGKLMLLRDPKVGRPTNLKAFAGVDNILLTWDPNQQSRIRGYRVYRSLPEQDGASPSGTRIAQPPLPTYRDFPPTTDEYAYKVSSVSRFYTAGNSTPTESESPATEAVVAKTGGVKFFWNDAVAKVGEKVEVMLSIENSMNYNVAGKSQVVSYDSEYLEPVKVVKTGLTEEFEVVDLVGRAAPSAPSGGASPSGAWQITIGSGAAGGGTPTLPAGGGKFLVLVFEAQKEGVTKVGGDAGATVSIAAGAAIAPYQLGDVDGDGDVDVEDLRLLAKLKNGNGRKHTADQLKAGDFNGNGKLDNADYQALRELLKEMGVL